VFAPFLKIGLGAVGQKDSPGRLEFGAGLLKGFSRSALVFAWM
jgi:hypothetical protein